MATSSSRTRASPSNMPLLRGPLLRLSSTSPAFASSTSSFSPHSSHFMTCSSSPAIANPYERPESLASSSTSLRFPIVRSTSPGRSMSVTKQRSNAVPNQKRTCMCSPTTHPGSFRCAYHRRLGDHHHPHQQHQSQTSSCHSRNSSSLNLRRSAMKNSLVRIGGVEGELVKRALTTLIRPSSHQQRRHEGFQHRPSRLSIVSKSEEL